MIQCSICQNEAGNQTHRAREMMFGMRENFDYLECGRCGCLQLLNVPADMGKYYPAQYYSMEVRQPKHINPLVRKLRRARARYSIQQRGLIGQLMVKLSGRCGYADWIPPEVGFDDAILDVGCGSGQLLLTLAKDGFNHLTGMDPFVTQDIHYSNGVRILKQSVTDLNEHYDFIVMHHSFEHMTNPREVLQACRRVLKPGQYMMIAMPVAGTYAWRTYGTDWIQLDAPRHVFIHSVKSIQLLAEQTGFALTRTHFDSDDLFFWGSEQYRRDIPHKDPRSYGVNPTKSHFTPEVIRQYKRQAAELNAQQDGDQACFLLRALP